MIKAEKINVPALTGMRAIAAGLVFFYHWFFTHAAHLPIWVRGPFEIGFVGVPIFFALSGFLITLRYQHEIATDQFNFWGYLYKRFIRIFPLYLFVLVFMVFAFGRPANMMPDDARQTVILLTMTQALFPSARLIGTTVGWTLTIEFIFYIIAPFLLRILRSDGHWPKWGVQFLWLSALSIGLGWLLSLLPTFGWDTIIGEDFYSMNHNTIFGHLPDFLIGMIFALIFIRRRDFPNLGGWGRALVGLSVIGQYLTMIGLAQNGGAEGAPINRFLAFLVALFASVCFLGLSLDQDHRSYITRFLASRPMVFLGITSYALYLIQLTEPVQWLYWLFLGSWLSIENQIWRAIWLLPISILISAILYYIIEKPSHRWLSKFVKGRVASRE